MNLLVLDLETTGLDPKTDTIIEVATALYSTDERAVLWSFSTIVPTVAHNPIPEINGITDEMLALAAWTTPMPIDDLCKNAERDYRHCGATTSAIVAIVAHNAEFDRSFANKLRVLGKPLEGLPWVCSQSDLVFPKTRDSQHLAHLAADHGLAFGGQRHRALSDVLLICDLLSCVDDLAEQVAEALKPRALFQSLQPFDRNAEAKKRGFCWNGETKRWLKRMPADTSIDATKDRPFRLRLVEGETR